MNSCSSCSTKKRPLLLRENLSIYNITYSTSKVKRSASLPYPIFFYLVEFDSSSFYYYYYMKAHLLPPNFDKRNEMDRTKESGGERRRLTIKFKFLWTALSSYTSKKEKARSCFTDAFEDFLALFRVTSLLLFGKSKHLLEHLTRRRHVPR